MDPNARDAESEAEDLVPTPFSFKIVLVLGVIYLGWRLVQFVLFLVERFL